MAIPVDPVRPRVFTRFAPERADARVFANFDRSPQRPTVLATFEPEVWRRAQAALRDAGLVAPAPEAPPGAPLSSTDALLTQIRSLLSPDNYQTQQKYVTAQVAAGQAYDYAVPTWCRHFLLTNADNTDTGAAGQLYYWYDNPQGGSKVLPQNYATLVGGQTISENSDFQWITVYANGTASAQGWELRFSGRPGDTVARSKGIQAPTRSVSTGGGAGPMPGGGSHPSPPPPI
jgi:hypothetical protein